MAIKAGQIIHVGNNTVVIDRIQTAGPGQLNTPTEIIYELGNYKSVAQVLDIPDLTFSLESYDASLSLEALLTGQDPTTFTSSTSFQLSTAQPVDMKSVFKAGQTATNPYLEVDSVALPFLTLEQVNYKFGLKNDASQTAVLRGDSIYYNAGSTYIEQATGTGVSGQTIATAHPAYGVVEGGVTRRVLNVTANGKRLVFGVDYTESYGTVSGSAAVTTITLTPAVATTSFVRIIYSSPTADSFPQSVHTLATVKPAAIRGKDIAIYLGGYTASTPFVNRLHGVQSVTCDYRVTLQKDEEFGNYHFVTQDFDVSTVNGDITVRAADAPTLVGLIQQITGVTDPTQSATAAVTPVPLALDIVLHNPVDNSVLKRLHVPDARLSVPGFSAKVQSKLDVTIKFASDTGELDLSLV